jgi:hypothetical protein
MINQIQNNNFLYVNHERTDYKDLSYLNSQRTYNQYNHGGNYYKNSNSNNPPFS